MRRVRRLRRTTGSCLGDALSLSWFRRTTRERRGAPAWRHGDSESQPSAGRHHRGASCAEGGDDLLGVDSLDIDRRRAEVGVPERALDDVERDALAGELQRVRVAQLVPREAAPDPARAASRRNSERTAAPDHGRPRVGPSMMQNSGPTGSSARALSQGRRCSQPHSSMPTWRRRPPFPLRTRTDPRRRGRAGRARAALGRAARHARQGTHSRPLSKASLA